MSYNISRIQIRTLELIIPKEFNAEEFLKETQSPLEFDVSRDLKEWNADNGSIQMEGVLEDDNFYLTKLDIGDDGSGTDYEEILVPLFKELKGSIEAVMVWEGGDSITELIIDKGEVKSERNIELLELLPPIET